MTSPRARFVAAVLEQMHAPYLWGAKGRVVRPGLRAFDCSGLVTWAFLQVGGPDWRIHHNTDRLLAECAPTETLQPGTLILYGPKGDASHVMVHVGGGVVVGASGGGSRTLTLADAEGSGARVKAFASVDYRPDRIAFRELPFP